MRKIVATSIALALTIGCSTSNLPIPPSVSTHRANESVQSAYSFSSSMESQWTTVIKEYNKKKNSGLTTQSIFTIPPSDEELIVQIQARPDYHEHKDTWDGLAKWVQTHPKTMQSVRKLTPPGRLDNEEQLLKFISYVQEHLPLELTEEDERESKARVQEFREYVQENGTREFAGEKFTQTAYPPFAGVPIYGTGDAALNSFASLSGVSSLPSDVVPKVYQDTGNSCSVAAWAFSQSSLCRQDSASGQAKFTYLRNRYISGSWFPWIYSLGVTPADLESWMRQDGGITRNTNRNYNNSITTLLQNVDRGKRPIITMSMGDAITDTAHYATVVGYDSNNIIFNNSATDSIKTFYFPITTFSVAWPMVMHRNALIVAGLLEIFLYPYLKGVADSLNCSIIRPLPAGPGTALGKTDGNWQFSLVNWPSPICSTSLAGVRRYSGTGRTEVHILSKDSDYSTFILQTTTALGCTDETWDFRFGDWNGDWVPDLIAIRRYSGTGRTEVHILNGADNFQTFLLNTVTALHTTDMTYAFDVVDWNNDGRLDVACIKKNASTTEVHILNGATNFGNYLLQTGTALHPTNSAWFFRFRDMNADGRPDLCAIKTASTGSGRIEVFAYNGSTNFDRMIVAEPTPLVAGPTAQNADYFIANIFDYSSARDLVVVNKSGLRSTEIQGFTF